MRRIAVLAAATLAAVPAHALTIRDDEGGSVIAYAMRMRDLAEPVRITGMCESSCTLYLAADDVCAARYAMFMFHAAYDLRDGERNENGTQYMLEHYPAPLREFIERRGGLSGAEIWLTGWDLIDMGAVRECR